MASAANDATREQVAMIGDGGWGTALARLLHMKGQGVVLWGPFPEYIEVLREKRENVKFLKGIPLPDDLPLSADLIEAFDGATMMVVAIPTCYMRSVLERVRSHYPRGLPIVTIAKGIEEGTMMRGSQIIADVLEDVPLGMLFGPSHAEEVARGLPTTIVAASQEPELARRIQQTFMTQRFRVYTSADSVGVELGAALKNVIAIAGGICEGLGFGDNSKAALITRGLAEITRLGVALGAQRETFAGLTGLGDLITTCVSPFGRNRHVGVEMAKGLRLQDVIDEMGGKVAEGVLTTRAVCALAEKHGVEMPISREIHNVLFDGKDPKQAVSDLMMRDPKPEMGAGVTGR